jgi:hypothetical protein
MHASRLFFHIATCPKNLHFPPPSNESNPDDFRGLRDLIRQFSLDENSDPNWSWHTKCDSIETVPNPRPETQLTDVNHRHVRKKKRKKRSPPPLRLYTSLLSPISGCGSRPRFLCVTRLSVTNTAPRFRVLWTSHTRQFCITAHRRPSVYFFSPKVFSPQKKPPNQADQGKGGPKKKRN